MFKFDAVDKVIASLALIGFLVLAISCGGGEVPTTASNEEPNLTESGWTNEGFRIFTKEVRTSDNHVCILVFSDPKDHVDLVCP